jgi:hypothetical protein
MGSIVVRARRVSLVEECSVRFERIYRSAEALADKHEIRVWSLEGERLHAAPYIVFQDLRHG